MTGVIRMKMFSTATSSKARVQPGRQMIHKFVETRHFGNKESATLKIATDALAKRPDSVRWTGGVKTVWTAAARSNRPKVETVEGN